MPEKVRAAGGEIFAVTSEPQTLASEAEQSWSLGFRSIGDPHHEIADACRERGWLQLFTNQRLEFVQAGYENAAHPNGYFQPGVLAVSREGRVLYRWRSRPTHANLGGATSRPLPNHVWAKLEEALGSKDATDAAPDEPDTLDFKPPPWPLFVMMLMANGNFLRARPFGTVEGKPPNRRMTTAVLKLAGAFAACALAFVTLPTLAVVAGLAAYAAFATPRVREIYEQFQSIPLAGASASDPCKRAQRGAAARS